MKKIHIKIYIIAILLLLSLSFAALILLNNHSSISAIAIIEKDGAIIKKIDLTKVVNPYIFSINDNLYPVKLKIECGKISFIDAQCPDKLCQKTGIISRPHQSAICLPARVCVHIEGENNEFDSITG